MLHQIGTAVLQCKNAVIYKDWQENMALMLDGMVQSLQMHYAGKFYSL